MCPPPPAFFGQKAFLGGKGGGGVYFEPPRGRDVIHPPSFTPPPVEGYFRGWGCIKFGPP